MTGFVDIEFIEKNKTKHGHIFIGYVVLGSNVLPFSLRHPNHFIRLMGMFSFKLFSLLHFHVFDFINMRKMIK